VPRAHFKSTHGGNYTLTIDKPDAFGAGKAGKIIALLEEKGFSIVASRVMKIQRSRRARSTRSTAIARSTASSSSS
jgi:nucleoside diphosphate kinase